MSSRRLVSVRIVHRLPVKFVAVFSGSRVSLRHRTVIAVTVVVVVIDVAIEMFRPVKPGPRANEYPAIKPLRPIIPIRGAVIRRCLVISVGANRGSPNLNRNLGRRAMPRNTNKTSRQQTGTEVLQSSHVNSSTIQDELGQSPVSIHDSVFGFF